jgi:hypothetical protein
MFGLMKPPVENLAYRSAYSRCCQFQRKFYGLISLPLLSYDAVFLYLCCADAGLVPESVIVQQKCCRMRSGLRLHSAPDVHVGRFCGALSLLMVDTKLNDDVRDKGSWMARIGKFLLQNSIAKAVRYVSQLNSSFHSLFEAWTATQIAVESDRTKLNLSEFVAPTARGVASVVTMMPGSAERPGFQDYLWDVGHHLGTAIVAADCALDWRDDLITGECNPVRSEMEATNAARLALTHLRQTVEATDRFFGATSRSAIVSRLVYAGLCKRFQERCDPCGVDCHANKVMPIDEHRGEALSACVSVAQKVGAAVGPKRVSNRPKRDTRQIECPQACQCSCQLLGGWLLLFGCTENH